jgi:hypothetical protein
MSTKCLKSLVLEIKWIIHNSNLDKAFNLNNKIVALNSKIT